MSARLSYTRLSQPGFSLSLVARLCCGGASFLIRLRNTDVSADCIFADLVDDDLFGNVRASHVEENRFIGSAVFLLEALVLNNHRQVELVPLRVHALQFDGHIRDLLGAVLAGDGELGVIALTQAPELVNFIMRSEERRVGKECRSRWSLYT